MHVDEIGRLFAATGAKWAEPPSLPTRDAAERAGFPRRIQRCLIRQRGGRCAPSLSLILGPDVLRQAFISTMR